MANEPCSQSEVLIGGATEADAEAARLCYF